MGENTLQPNGKKIHTLRMTRGWTQTDLQYASGVKLSTIRTMEKGRPTFPRTLAAVAGALEVDLHELIVADSPPPPPAGAQSPYGFQALIEEKTEGFVGRDYVFAALDAFLAEESKGYFLLEGHPGMGKSAIMAQYVQQTGCLAHFNVRASGIIRTSQCLENLCMQLIARYQLPYPTTLPLGATHDGVFLMRLLEEASARIPEGERLVLAIDALDEVDCVDHTSGANVLYLPPVLPARVYFVLTKRWGIKPPFVVHAPQRIYNLLEYPAESQRDVQTYIRQGTDSPQLAAWITAQGSTIDEFVTVLAAKSENNFMYLRYVLADIVRGRFQGFPLEHLPTGLEGYYEDHWRRMGMAATPLPRPKIHIVYVLAEVRHPVSPQLLADLVQEEPLTVQEVLTDWSQFLHVQQVACAPRYSVYHDSFRTFLARQDILQVAGITRQAINSGIGKALWQDLYSPE